MKKVLALLPLILLLSGCSSLIPKQVEVGQKKVKAVPVYDNSALEDQRQAAAKIAADTQQAKEAAIREASTVQVTEPLLAANQVAQGLTTSLGPPAKAYSGTAPALAAKLTGDRADLNTDIAKYAKTVAPEVGKKIEGTGFFRISYFAYIGLLLLLGALIWFGIKVYGMFNPVVGTAAGAVGRVSSSVLSAGFGELVSGGQQFLQWVDNSNLEGDVKDWITNTFKLAHQTAQSPATQQTVDKLTETATAASTVPFLPVPNPAPITPPAASVVKPL